MIIYDISTVTWKINTSKSYSSYSGTKVTQIYLKWGKQQLAMSNKFRKNLLMHKMT